MKLTGIVATVGGWLAVGLLQVGAVPIACPDYQDIDWFGDGVHGVWLSPGESVTGNFDIKSGDGDVWTVPSSFLPPEIRGLTFADKAGFTPGISPEIRSAQAYFYIGGLDADELIDIDLASLDFVSGAGGAQRFFVFGGDIGVSLLVALNTSGELEYIIRNESTAGHYFAVKAAQLQATVPDGGITLFLLGGAMATLAVVRRKFA